MATLKDHQNAMVDLLANGSAIPASAARLAHALHDVLGLLLERDSVPRGSRVSEHMGTFIQDVRLAADLDSVTDRLNSEEWRAHALDLELDALKEAYRELLAGYGGLTNQRDAYKARCESLEADIKRTHTCDYEAVVLERDKLRGLVGAGGYQDNNCKAMD